MTDVKIALVGPAYPFRGGIAQFSAVLYQKLIQRKHKPLFVSFRKQFPKLLFPGTTQFDTSKERIPVDSIRVFKPLDPLSWWRSARVIRSYQPDLIVFNWWLPFFGPGFGAVSRLAVWGADTNILYIVHNAIPHEKRPGDKLFTNWAFRPVHYFIAPSETVRKDMLDLRPDLNESRLRLVPHPVYDCYDRKRWTQDSARKDLKITESRILLFFGYIRRYKGVRNLIKTIPLLQEKFQDDFKLLIVGEFYEGRDDILQLIKELNVSDRILLVDRYVPNEEVEKYFRAADVGILPYESATQSGIIQIAHDFGLPVITTNVGGLPEVVQHETTGFLVPPGDPKALADAAFRYFEGDWGTRFRAAIEQTKSRYSWDPLIESIEEAAGTGWR